MLTNNIILGCDFFSTDLTFSYCLEDMPSRAKQGVIGIRRFLLSLESHCMQCTDRSQGLNSCPFSNDNDEREMNFLFVCPKYETLREIYLLERFYLRPLSINGNFTSRCMAGLYYHLQSLFLRQSI